MRSFGSPLIQFSGLGCGEVRLVPTQEGAWPNRIDELEANGW